MNDATTSSSTPLLTNRLYDALKFAAQILLPAAGTLYYAVATIWGLPNPEEVVGTIVAVDAFLGALLSISTKQYDKSDAKYDGSIDIAEQDDVKTFSLSLNQHPETIEKMSQVVFKVNK